MLTLLVRMFSRKHNVLVMIHPLYTLNLLIIDEQEGGG